jgi:hypothetical protein
MLGTVLPDEPSQRMNQCKPLIPCGYAALPFLLQVNEEAANEFSRQIDYRQSVCGYTFAFWVPSRSWLEFFGGAISGILKIADQAARSID